MEYTPESYKNNRLYDDSAKAAERLSFSNAHPFEWTLRDQFNYQNLVHDYGVTKNWWADWDGMIGDE